MCNLTSVTFPCELGREHPNRQEVFRKCMFLFQTAILHFQHYRVIHLSLSLPPISESNSFGIIAILIILVISTNAIHPSMHRS